jgi:transposase InsO family protein
MFTRARARMQAGTAAESTGAADASRSVLPANRTVKLVPASVSPSGDETDVEDLDMDVSEDSDIESVKGEDEGNDDDFEVIVNRLHSMSGASKGAETPVEADVPYVRPRSLNGTTVRAQTSIDASRWPSGRRSGVRKSGDVELVREGGERDDVSHHTSRSKRLVEGGTHRSVGKSDDVQSNNANVSAVLQPVKWIKPDKFSAAVPIESYISHFEAVAEYNQWAPRDKVAHLKAALTGEAAQILWDSGRHDTMSYDELISKLKARFGSVDHRERFACQLRSLKRQQGQTLQQLYNEIRRLLALAYPDAANSSLGEVIARDAFLSALDDRELEIKVRDREPTDLDSAFRAAMRIETYLRPTGADGDRDRSARLHRESFDGRRARQVKEPAATESDETARALRELREQLAKSQRTQDELSRELGRVRLLAETQAEMQARVQYRQQTGQEQRQEQYRQFTRDNGMTTSATRARGPSGVCYACGDPSHYARECPTRRRGTEGSGTNDNAGGGARAASPGGGKPVRMLQDHKLDKAAYLPLNICGRWVDCLLDTGSEVCLFPGDYASTADGVSTGHKLYAANGTSIAVTGEVRIEAAAGPLRFTISGLCSKNVTEVILGLNFLRAQEAVWDFKTGTILINDVQFELRSRDVASACRRIILEETSELPPRSEVVLPAYIQFKGGINSSGDWATRARRIVKQVHAANTLLPQRAVGVPVRVLNAGNEAVVLRAGTLLAEAEAVTVGSLGNEVCKQAAPEVRTGMIASMVDQVDDSVTEEARNELTQILNEYSGAFSFDDLDIGHATAAQHTIDVGDARPVRQRLRRHPPAHQAAIDTHIRDMLRQDVIEPAQSPWAANLVVVKKKTGDYRCCADFRGLNLATLKDAYSLPRIDACLDALSGATWFSTFDLRNSYYQIEMAEADRDKTAFICRAGQYRYKRMPMGLCNSGATFQRLVDISLSGLSYEICLAYIDDILVFSRSLPEHLSRLRTVLGRLQDAGLKIKPSKTYLLRRSVGFLDHLISAEGIGAHPEKTEQILNWGTPRCVRDVRAFIGITSYYRKHVKNYAAIASPLTSLTAKNRQFEWSPECQNAFDTLKRALASPPILAMPRDEGQYLLDTDSSDFAIGAVLSQIQDNEERVIAYASRHLCAREQNYCVTRRELLAAVYFLKYFRHYLLGASQPVRLRTDHAAIQWLRRIPEPVGQQARWLETMEEYDIVIEHRPGRLHSNADAMSRDPCYNRKCCPQFEQTSCAVVRCPLKNAEDSSRWAEGGRRLAETPLQRANVGMIRAEGHCTEVESGPWNAGGAPTVTTTEAGLSLMQADTRSSVEFAGGAVAETDTAGFHENVGADLANGVRPTRPDADFDAGAGIQRSQGQAEARRIRREADLQGNIASPWQNDRFLAEQQRADPGLSKIIEFMERGSTPPSWDEIAPLPESAKSLWRQWQRLSLREGVLMRRFEEADGRRSFEQLIIPRQMRAEFLSSVHSGVAGGHFGRHRTELAVKARAYWPGWTGDVRRALRTCHACTRYMRGKPPRQVALKPILCGEPWELLSLDITGPHPVSRQGFVYILTMQDHFSKWAEAVPIRRHTAPIVARAVFEHIFMRFGTARRLLTDQGPEFESDMLAELCRLMRIDKARTTPYHPQCNGMIERFHRVLNTMLAKVIDDDQRDWPDHLPTVMAAYRASVHEATGFTPNSLILGREARLPVDLVYGLPPDRGQDAKSYNDFVDERVERMSQDFQMVRENLGRLAHLRMDKYDIKHNVPPLSVGQKVWYFCPRRKPNLSPKWQNFYCGPYTVVRVVDPHVVIISRSRRSRPISVHRDKLKLVIEDESLGISVPPSGERWTENENYVASSSLTVNGQTDAWRRPKRERRAPKRYDDFCRAVSLFALQEEKRCNATLRTCSGRRALGLCHVRHDVPRCPRLQSPSQDVVAQHSS